MKLIRSVGSALVALALLLPTATAQANTVELGPVNIRLSNDTNSVSIDPGFQVSPDGSRVVFAASIGAPDRLFSVPADGSAIPTALSEIVNFADTVTEFAISPDGAWVVYLYGDEEDEGQRELYSVPITGGAPVKLNGPLPATVSVDNFAISPTSDAVVFRTGNYIDEIYELFSAPIAGGTPTRLNDTAVAGGGVGNDFKFTPDGERVVYKGNLDNIGVIELYHSHISTTGSTRVNDDLPAGGAVYQFRITPDGQSVLYLADQDTPSVLEIFRAPIITTPGDVTLATDGLTQLSAPLTAEGITKLSGPLATDGDVTTFRISPDGTKVVYKADAEQDELHELYQVPMAGGAPVKLNGPLIADGDVSSFSITPNSKWVLYIADERFHNVFELFGAKIDGSARLRLSGEMGYMGYVYDYEVTPDSRSVIYRANQEVSDQDELYRAQLPTFKVPAIAPPPVKLNAPLAPGGTVHDYAISPSGDRVGYIAGQQASDSQELYTVPLAGGPATRQNRNLVVGGDVGSFQFASAGRVIYMADQETDNFYSLFASFKATSGKAIIPPGEPLGDGPTG